MKIYLDTDLNIILLDPQNNTLKLIARMLKLFAASFIIMLEINASHVIILMI